MRPGDEDDTSSSFGSCGLDLTATAIPIPYVCETRAPLALNRDELPFEEVDEEAVRARVTRKPIPPTSSSLSRPSTTDAVRSVIWVASVRLRVGEASALTALEDAEPPAPCQTQTSRLNSDSVNRFPVLSSIRPSVDKSIRLVIRTVAVVDPSSVLVVVSETVEAMLEPAVERCKIRVRSTAEWSARSEAR